MTIQDLHLNRTYIIQSIDSLAGSRNRKKVMDRMVALLPQFTDLCSFDTETIVNAAIQSLNIKHLQMPPKPKQYPDRYNIDHLKYILSL